MIDTGTLTCVYTIKDKSAFNDERNRINSNFKSVEGEPWAITSMSLGHEIRRLELLEAAHDVLRYDLMDEIFGLIDPAPIGDISDLQGF